MILVNLAKFVTGRGNVDENTINDSDFARRVTNR